MFEKHYELKGIPKGTRPVSMYENFSVIGEKKSFMSEINMLKNTYRSIPSNIGDFPKPSTVKIENEVSRYSENALDNAAMDRSRPFNYLKGMISKSLPLGMSSFISQPQKYLSTDFDKKNMHKIAVIENPLAMDDSDDYQDDSQDDSQDDFQDDSQDDSQDDCE